MERTKENWYEPISTRYGSGTNGGDSNLHLEKPDSDGSSRMALRFPQLTRSKTVKEWEPENRPAPTSPLRNEDWSWASPQLKQEILTDPIAVLKDRGLNVAADMPQHVIYEFVRVVSLLWLDSKIVPLDQFRIDPYDEGLLFGRGAWESTRTFDGVPWLWPMHIDRLRRTAEMLRIQIASERLPTGDQVTEYVRTLTEQDLVIRLNVTAGRPGKTGIVWMTAGALPMPATAMRLRTCRSPVQKGQAYLTLKTFQYATRLRIAQQASEAGFDTALMLDAEGNLLEAANANIFVRLPDGWVTPKADGGLLPGTVRQYLLQNAPMPIREAVVPRALLGKAKEAFVTNSNVGIIPIVQVDGQKFPIGNETQTLSRWLLPKCTTASPYRFVDNRLTLR